MKPQLCREFSMIKTCSEIQNLRLTAHTRPTPEYLATIFFLWPRFSRSMRPVSCFSSCLDHAQKEFWVILPFHDKGDCRFSFHSFFHKCRATQSYHKTPYPVKFLAFKACPNCIGRSWNSSTERPERQLHS